MVPLAIAFTEFVNHKIPSPLISRMQVYEEAQRVFSAMLDRQQKAERIKSVVAMLKRYETVFRLPTRIRQATERGEFEQVIAEHRKAKALMETLAASSSEVWRNLFAEVEKVLAPSFSVAGDAWEEARDSGPLSASSKLSSVVLRAVQQRWSTTPGRTARQVTACSTCLASTVWSLHVDLVTVVPRKTNLRPVLVS